MVGPVVDVGPKTSSRYQAPDFSPIGRAGMMFGQQLSEFGKRRRQKKKENERKQLLSTLPQQGGYQETMDWLMQNPDMLGDQGVNNLVGNLFNQEQAAQQHAFREAQAAANAEQQERQYQLQREKFAWQQERADNPDPKTPKIITMINPKDKSYQTMDIATEQGYNLFSQLSSQGYVQGSPIQTDSSNLTTGAKTEAQKQIIGIQDLSQVLNEVHDSFDVNMLKTIPQMTAGLAAKGEKLGLPIGEALQGDIESYYKMRAQVSTFTNKFLNELSGAAISESEAKRLEQQLPTMADSPSEFIAKYNAAAAFLEWSMNNRGSKIEGDNWEHIKVKQIGSGDQRAVYDPMKTAADALGLGFDEQITSEPLPELSKMNPVALAGLSLDQIEKYAEDPNLSPDDYELLVNQLKAIEGGKDFSAEDINHDSDEFKNWVVAYDRFQKEQPDILKPLESLSNEEIAARFWGYQQLTPEMKGVEPTKSGFDWLWGLFK